MEQWFEGVRVAPDMWYGLLRAEELADLVVLDLVVVAQKGKRLAAERSS